MATRMLIVEDHELLAHTLAAALEPEGFDTEAVVPESGSDVLEAAADLEPAVVLLDLHLGFDIGNGLGLIGPLTDAGVTVVVLTADQDPVHQATAVKAGASGVIHKSQPFDDLVAAVVDAAAGRPLLSPWERQEILAKLDSEPEEQLGVNGFSRLTPREEEILACLAEGKTAREIADEHVVSVATVRAQIASVRTKLGVPNQLAAASLALRSGWTPTEGRTPAAAARTA